MYIETIPQKLRKARLDAGYTQNQTSEITGIPQNNICRYEKGERQPDLETLCKLIDFYQVSADWILGTNIKGHK